MNINIEDNPENERLDIILARLLPEYSRTQIKEWIDSGNILIDGKLVKAKIKPKGGEIVSVNPVLKPKPKEWEAEPIPLQIEYEDESFLIINKPAGLVVHPGAGNASKTMLNALLHHSADLEFLPRAGIIHRLDKETSGLLVVAKTAAAYKNISNQLKKHELQREYQAIVQGILISGGKVDAPLDRHPLDRKRRAVIDTGKPALTHYRVAEKFRAHTRLKLQLATGRTHQIRVHMMHIRHPVVGDPVYGRLQLSKGMSEELRNAIKSFKRQALHASALALMHPVTNEMMRFEIDLPDDMKALLAILREDSK